MNEGCHTGQGLTMADMGMSLEELAGQPLEMLAREGAKVILSMALQEEVTAFLQRGRYECGQCLPTATESERASSRASLSQNEGCRIPVLRSSLLFLYRPCASLK